MTQDQGPERVQDNGKNEDESKRGVQLAFDLAALPEPNVVHVFLCLLLLLNLDIPLALDTLLGLLSVGSAVVDLDDSEREHAERQQLECVLQRSSVGDFGQEGVLLACLFVGGGLDGAEGTFHCIELAC